MTFILTILIGISAAAAGVRLTRCFRIDESLAQVGGLSGMLTSVLLTLRLRGYETFGELFAGTMASIAGIAAVAGVWIFVYCARQSTSRLAPELPGPARCPSAAPRP